MTDPREALIARVDAALDRVLPKLSSRARKKLLRLDGAALIRRLRAEVRRVKLRPKS